MRSMSSIKMVPRVGADNTVQLPQDTIRRSKRRSGYQLLRSIYFVRHDRHFPAKCTSWDCESFGDRWTAFDQPTGTRGCCRRSTRPGSSVIYSTNRPHQIRTDVDSSRDQDHQKSAHTEIPYQLRAHCTDFPPYAKTDHHNDCIGHLRSRSKPSLPGESSS